ncbi:hypothetical protein RJT13_12630 [Segatella copri]|uniref:hypothetical protein n=1 Tax=Segatella copri TaxID=165179 RepID=UPI002915D405|nr:hypothetical protein [Segatella copri]MDV3122480.1 hypothetical protein [Segatella copri]
MPELREEQLQEGDPKATAHGCRPPFQKEQRSLGFARKTPSPQHSTSKLGSAFG